MTTIYVTKYALTTGIFKAEGEVIKDGGLAWYIPKGGLFRAYAHGNDFHLTEEAALKRAEDMRIQKLQSLDKQIKKVSII